MFSLGHGEDIVVASIVLWLGHVGWLTQDGCIQSTRGPRQPVGYKDCGEESVHVISATFSSLIAKLLSREP